MSGRAKRCSHWLLRRAAKEPTLFGFDFSFAPPLIERGEYLPGEPDVPRTAREFWAYVDLEERRRGSRRGELPRAGAPPPLLFRHRRRRESRLRPLPPVRCAAQRARRAQDGQRLRRDRRCPGRQGELRRDALPPPVRRQGRDLADGPAARTWQRGRRDLHAHLPPPRGPERRQAAQPGRSQPGAEGLGSQPARLRFEPNDHQTDALATAAGMRTLAQTEPRAFDPVGLTPEIARSEGWTFGVL